MCQEVARARHVLPRAITHSSRPRRDGELCRTTGTVDLNNNWTVGGRTCHISVKHFFLRDLKENSDFSIVWVCGFHQHTTPATYSRKFLMGQRLRNTLGPLSSSTPLRRNSQGRVSGLPKISEWRRLGSKRVSQSDAIGQTWTKPETPDETMVKQWAWAHDSNKESCAAPWGKHE